MDHATQILKMRSLGFNQEQIASRLGLSLEELKESFQTEKQERKKQYSSGRRKRLPVKKDGTQLKRRKKEAAKTIPVLETLRPVQEIRSGFYMLTADDLLSFASRLQEYLTVPPDPYQDYVQKDDFQQQYGISDTTLQRHQKEGVLVVYKLGNKQYLKKSQVVEALEKGKL